ncbi:heterokaryon incompatibility protein-domain-containing protein [Boeremia exigua]|uniref:heterokaryon incompatibility protein-domain-containing protein n=1 Tax=Boeremia exigua TaxID=749465 RepID=UPI001E8E09AF|nr:heterokaryon incompatibility protein-domain-containing protein [Boeremia exigua]KAH6611867.1 heterokaryon incompatibility protein-domain-containing protein [Boeremia exigua]
MALLPALLSRRLPYRYTPLDKDQVRLLKLWPGERTSQLSCSLQNVDLLSYDDHTAESPIEGLRSFDTISYVWGKASKKVEIMCDARTMRIGANLADALRRFRDSKEITILWVDALCINQKDTDERAAQVQLMGLIYFKARQVRIWLGRDHEPVYCARHAATLIRKFAFSYRNTFGVAARELSEQFFREQREANDVNWKAVRHLLQREWFERVWVVQEFGLSRDATFYCGETQIIQTDLCDFVYSLFNSRSGLWISYEINNRLLLLGQRYKRATRNDDRIELESSPEEAENFLDILSQTRGLECTDERDSIFAFLGHPSAFKQHRFDADPYRSYSQNYYDGRLPIIQPNYDKSATFHHACINLAINAVKDRDLGLQLLTHIAHNENTLSLDIPSWVPLWNVIDQGSHFHGCNRLYHSSGSLSPTSMNVYTPAGNTFLSRLCLRASRLATIRYAATDKATISVQTLVETLFPERAAGASYLKQHPFDWPAATSRTRTSANDWAALAMTLTAGLITTDTDLVPVPAEPHIDRHINGLECYLRRHERGPPRIQCDFEDDIGDNFHMDLDLAGISRVFYVTTNNHFGLAPMVTREGDQVWLPRGAPMPFVLRPLSQGVFKILGQAYLHGVMQGEMVDKMTEKAFQTVLLC